MAKRWTADTIPPVPRETEEFTGEPRRAMFLARHQAVDDLLNAEQAEAAARSMRAIANQSCEHYETLLEEVVSEPLFEIKGEPDGPA